MLFDGQCFLNGQILCQDWPQKPLILLRRGDMVAMLPRFRACCSFQRHPVCAYGDWPLVNCSVAVWVRWVLLDVLTLRVHLWWWPVYANGAHPVYTLENPGSVGIDLMLAAAIAWGKKEHEQVLGAVSLSGVAID